MSCLPVLSRSTSTAQEPAKVSPRRLAWSIGARFPRTTVASAGSAQNSTRCCLTSVRALFPSPTRQSPSIITTEPIPTETRGMSDQVSLSEPETTRGAPYAYMKVTSPGAMTSPADLLSQTSPKPSTGWRSLKAIAFPWSTTQPEKQRPCPCQLCSYKRGAMYSIEENSPVTDSHTRSSAEKNHKE